MYICVANTGKHRGRYNHRPPILPGDTDISNSPPTMEIHSERIILTKARGGTRTTDLLSSSQAPYRLGHLDIKSNDFNSSTIANLSFLTIV